MRQARAVQRRQATRSYAPCSALSLAAVPLAGLAVCLDTCSQPIKLFALLYCVPPPFLRAVQMRASAGWMGVCARAHGASKRASERTQAQAGTLQPL